jgi:hypothetical protein
MVGVGVTKGYEMVHAGLIPTVMVGRRRYATRESLERLATPPALSLPMAQAELEAHAGRGDPQPLKTEQSDRGGDRKSPRSRFTSIAPRPIDAE